MSTNWNPTGPTYPAVGAPMQPFPGVQPFPPMSPMAPPRPRMGLKRATRAYFQNYARFDGRAGRSENWWALLGVWLITLVIVVLGGVVIDIDARNTALAMVVSAIYCLWALAILIPSLALQVRRLHDTNHSGWLVLLGLIPFVGGIVILVYMCSASNPDGGRFDGPTQPAVGD